MVLQVLLPLSGIVDEALDNNHTVESSTDIFTLILQSSLVEVTNL